MEKKNKYLKNQLEIYNSEINNIKINNNNEINSLHDI